MRLPTHVLVCLTVSLLLLVFAVRAQAADPSPTPTPPPDPAVKALSDKLIAAPDDAARDALLAAAPPALAHGQPLRKLFHHDYGLLIYAGDYARATTLALYARRLNEQNNDPLGVAKEEQNLANIDAQRGDNPSALARFESCRRIYAAAGNKEALAGALLSIGIMHQEAGDYRAALEGLHQAEALYREVNYKEGIINCLNTLGNVFNDQAMHDRAMEYYQQALNLAGDDESWQPYLFHNMANVYEARNDLTHAAELVERSVALAEKQGVKPVLATALQTLANYHAQGEHPDRPRAEKEYQRSLDIAETAGDKRRLTSVLSSLGDFYREDGHDLPKALALVERASALARETGEPLYIWRSRTLEGKLRHALGQPAEARAAFEEAIAAIEDARGHLAGNDEGAAAFLEDKLDPYQEMVALLVEEKRPADALAMAERSKARVLTEILRSPKLDPAQRMTPAERTAAQAQAAAVANANRELLAARRAQPPTPAARLAELQSTLDRARHEREAAEQNFFAAHPELRDRHDLIHSLDQSNPAALAGLLTDPANDPHARIALLEYVVTADRTILFTITAGTTPDAPALVRADILPLDRATLDHRTQEFRRALADRSMGWQSAARDLGDALLAPARSACAGAQRLVIVPDGPLWELPFQALSADGKTAVAPMQTLWERWPVSLAPSLTFLSVSRALAAGRPPLPGTPRLLACGDPSLGNETIPNPPSGSALMADETVPLPDAARQVRALGELYGADHSRTLVGADARENEFKRLVGDYDVIHLATHGFLNDQAPMYSRLLMAQTNLAPDEDGLLEAWEWLPLKLHARLAVLSACETGRGRIGAGEGVLGLSWALFVAGCPASVVTQWKVDSASTTELMVNFHRRLLDGAGPSVALRDASLALAKKPGYQHPFYWAPFVLVGAGERIVEGKE